MTSTLVCPSHAQTRSGRLTYVLVLGLLAALGPFAVDLYLPAFPAVRADLAATESAVQITLTATMIGFGFGQLVIGPWSDAVGRRMPLLVATGVHVLASLGVAASPDVRWMVVFRILQGVGAAGGGVVATAIVRDVFGGTLLIRMLARVALVTGLAPILAPVVGSQLLRLLHWRGLFVGVAGYGVLILVLAFGLIAETLPEERRTAGGGRGTATSFMVLLRDREFVGVAVIGGLLVAGVFSYLSSSPFLFQDVYGLTPQQYGILFAINAIGFVIGSQTGSRILRRVAPQWLLVWSLPALAVLASVIAICGAVGVPSPVILTILFLFLVGAGCTVPCLQILGLAGHQHEAGTAAALLGATNMGVAGIAAPIVGAIGIESAAPMGAVMAAALGLATASLWALIRPRTISVVL
jgi:DHA1 family bicyclomycin/chloramphenicol resistance-like MFS transporter